MHVTRTKYKIIILLILVSRIFKRTDGTLLITLARLCFRPCCMQILALCSYVHAILTDLILCEFSSLRVAGFMEIRDV